MGKFKQFKTGFIIEILINNHSKTVVELKNVDFTVFETDLGLLPGGKIKLIKSSEIPLSNLIR